MRKTMVILAIASALVAGMASCKKKEMPREAIKQNVDVTLTSGQDYTFTLPENLRDDEYKIITQAAHYSVSSLGTNSAGERIYQYKPSATYTGSDVVVLSNDWEREQMGQHPQGPPPGGCKEKEGEEDHYIITINFVIKETSDIAEM